MLLLMDLSSLIIIKLMLGIYEYTSYFIKITYQFHINSVTILVFSAVFFNCKILTCNKLVKLALNLLNSS